MDAQQQTVAQNCLNGSEANTMGFPEVVGSLAAAGFESYAVDFRRSAATYYLPGGESVVLPTHAAETPVAARFDAEALGAAIREARMQVPGYTYLGFCAKARAAGCTGYIVSFPGRRAVYFDRTGEVHTEHFP
jgi:uncharacterized protein YbcV (DUF1398 family)